MGKISSALKEKCPRCDEGDLFEYKSYLPITKKTFLMKKYCPNCGMKYEKELGFFYGAMYVSYALNIALLTFVILVYLIFFRETYSWLHFGIAYISITLLCIGLIYRMSRALWVNFFTKYEPGVKTESNLTRVKE